MASRSYDPGRGESPDNPLGGRGPLGEEPPRMGRLRGLEDSMELPVPSPSTTEQKSRLRTKRRVAAAARPLRGGTRSRTVSLSAERTSYSSLTQGTLLRATDRGRGRPILSECERGSLPLPSHAGPSYPGHGGLVPKASCTWARMVGLPLGLATPRAERTAAVPDRARSLRS